MTVAVRRARVDPADAVFVGDAVADVHACAEAGVPCIALVCGGTSAAELKDAGAAAVYRDPAHLLARFDDSILAEADGLR